METGDFLQRLVYIWGAELARQRHLDPEALSDSDAVSKGYRLFERAVLLEVARRALDDQEGSDCIAGALDFAATCATEEVMNVRHRA
jgi:hypothetical protein